MSNFIFDITNNNKIKNILGIYGKNNGKGNYGKIKALNSLDDEIKKTPNEKIKRFSISCYKNVHMRALMNLTNSKNDELLDITKERNLSPEFIINVFLEYLKDNDKKIKNFLDLRKNLECKVLVENYIEAENILEEIMENHGSGIWFIDARMSIDSLKGIEVKKEIYGTSLSSQGSLILGYLFEKHTSHNALSFRQKTKINIIDSARGQKNRKNYADFLSTLLLTETMDSEREFENVIRYTHKLFPIDKYIFIKKSLIEEVGKLYLSRKKVPKYLQDFILEVSNLNIEDCWSKLDIFLKDKVTPFYFSDKNLNKIISNYASGNYLEAISDCEVFLKDNPRNLLLNDILARSIIFSGQQKKYSSRISNKSFFGALVTNLIKAYQFPDQYNSAIEYAEDLNFRFQCFEFSKAILPPFYISYHYQNQDKLRKSLVEACLSDIAITPKFLSTLITQGYLTPYDDFKDIHRLTKSREIRNELESYLTTNGIESERVNNYLSELAQLNDITLPDLKYIESQSLLKINDIDSLIKIINKTSSNKKSSLILFPMKILAERVDNNIDSIGDFTQAAIFSHQYQKYYDRSYRDITSFFVDKYLASRHIIKPSEILLNEKMLSADELYLLSDVCDEQVLSGLESISDAVIMYTERLKLINHLLEKNIRQLLSIESQERLENEEVMIYQKLLVSKLTNHHAKNKINIDFYGIFNTRKDYYESAKEVITKIKEGDESIYVDYYLSSSGEDELPSDRVLTKEQRENAKRYHYGLIYSNIINDFIMNNEFGLVRYLSSEIRHGVLPNHLRSVFESESLVTSKVLSKDSVSSYEPPYFWINELKFLTYDETIRMTKLIQAFSELIDDQIQITNNLIRPITISDLKKYQKAEAPTTAFSFVISDEQIEAFMEHINVFMRNYQPLAIIPQIAFEDNLKEFIWVQLEKCFMQVRQITNEVIKPSFATSCDKLINSLKDIRSISDNKSIIEKVKLAKYNINEKLSSFEEWFRKPSNDLAEDFDIIPILHASKEYINGIYSPHKIDINFMGIDNVKWIMSNHSVLHLTRSLITMYMNCLKHGATHTHTVINVTVSTTAENYNIRVTNEILKEKRQELVDKKIIDEVKSFKYIKNDHKLSDEGGTGLYKVYKNISEAFPQANFYLEIGETDISQIIQFKKVMP